MKLFLTSALLVLLTLAFQTVRNEAWADDGKRMSTERLKEFYSQDRIFTWLNNRNESIDFKILKNHTMTIFRQSNAFMDSGIWEINDADEICMTWKISRGGKKGCFSHYDKGNGRVRSKRKDGRYIDLVPVN